MPNASPFASDLWPKANISLYGLLPHPFGMTQESESRSLDKVIVRLPDGMRERLKGAAETNKRSMNAEIVARLQASLDNQGDSSHEIPSKIAEKMASVSIRATLWSVYSVLLEIAETPGSDIRGTLKRMRDGVQHDLSSELGGADLLLKNLSEIQRYNPTRTFHTGEESVKAIATAVLKDIPND